MLCICAIEGTLETNLFCIMVDVDESGGEICWAETTLAVLAVRPTEGNNEEICHSYFCNCNLQ